MSADSIEKIADLLPCPFCGNVPDDDLIDVLYPNGTRWREENDVRIYGRGRKGGRCWTMHCQTYAGGCGAEITGDTREETIAAWNRRALPSHAELERDAGGVLGEVLAEVERAIRKFPTWPTDPLHALAVLGEEFGELTKEALQLVYEPHKTSAAEVRKEAIQTAAMALRWVNSIDRYEYTRGIQHEQGAIAKDKKP